MEPRFKEQFQIAHSTHRYQGFLSVLPAEYVGTAEHLTLIVETISQAAAEAFQEQGMAVPPWRRAAATLSKWTLVGSFFHQTLQACNSHKAPSHAQFYSHSTHCAAPKLTVRLASNGSCWTVLSIDQLVFDRVSTHFWICCSSRERRRQFTLSDKLGQLASSITRRWSTIIMNSFKVTLSHQIVGDIEMSVLPVLFRSQASCKVPRLQSQSNSRDCR